MDELQITEFHAQNMGWAFGTVVFIAVTSLLLGLLARGVGMLFGISRQEQRKAFWGFTFAGPWIVGFIIFVLGPALASLLYSFTGYTLGDKLVFYRPEDGFSNYKDFWIGLDNYRDLLTKTEVGTGRLFKQAIFNSFYYTLIGVPLQIIAALAMAMLLNRQLKGISVFRTIYYLPVILAASPAALLAWRYMFVSNGGFINNTLRGFAETFFIFDWIYRYFLYFIEGFNGFYASVARGETIGPLKYILPAFMGLLLLGSLAGEWNIHKRQRAYQFAEIMAVAVLGNMASVGVFRSPVDLSWTYVAGIAFAAMVLANTLQEKHSQARLWLWVGLGLFALSLGMTLFSSSLNHPDTSKYIIALIIGSIPLLLCLPGNWTVRKYRAIGGAMAVLAMLIFIRAIPGQFDGGGLRTLGIYLSFGSTVNEQIAEDTAALSGLIDELNANPENSDRDKRNAIGEAVAEIYTYWKGDYNKALFSAYWLYALVIASLLALYLLDETYPRTRNYVLGGALLFFALIGFNTFRDGQAYFDGFEKIKTAATLEGVTFEKDITHYHFVSFRDRTNTLPSDERVPQWLDNELWTKPSLVMITMWSSGASMLIFLAALKGVPGTLYEAAEVDGANALQKFFKITLPMISPAMFYNIVIGVIAALQTFESIYIIRDPSGRNDASLRSAAYFLYTRTFNDLAIGQGAAASWILAAIILTLTVMQFRYSKWVNYEV